MHPNYGIKSDTILKHLLYDPSLRLSSTDTLLNGSNIKLSVKDMTNIGAGPVGDIPVYIREYILYR